MHHRQHGEVFDPCVSAEFEGQTFQLGRKLDDLVIRDIRRTYAAESQIRKKGLIARTADLVRVSPGTVRRYISATTEEVEHRGRPAEISEDIINFIEELIDEDPSIYLDEIKEESEWKCDEFSKIR